MNLDKELSKLHFPFSIAIDSGSISHFKVVVETLLHFLKNTDKEIVCLTLKESAWEINKKLELYVKTDRLFFVDAISIFKDYGLPYRNFDAVNRPDLIDDIWIAMNMQIMERKRRSEDIIVVLYGVYSLCEYLDINDGVIFLSCLIKQLKRAGSSVVLITGTNEKSPDKFIFHSLANNIIDIQ